MCQRVWCRKNIILWGTKGCGVWSSTRSESCLLLSSKSAFSEVFNVTAHCPVVCVPQCVHRPAAGWGAEAAGLPITVSPNRTTNLISWQLLSSLKDVIDGCLFGHPWKRLSPPHCCAGKGPSECMCSVCLGSPAADRKWSSWWGWWTTCCWRRVWMSTRRS